MRVGPGCPRCGADLHAPGLWSSAWQCDSHGAVQPLQPVVQPTPELVRTVAADAASSRCGCRWPLPRAGWSPGSRWPATSAPAPAPPRSPAPGRRRSAGSADLVLVAEEPGIGLGARFAGIDGPRPGRDPRRRPPDAKVEAAGHPTALWRCAAAPTTGRPSSARRSAAGSGRCSGRRPPGFLLIEHVVLHDLRDAAHVPGPPVRRAVPTPGTTGRAPVGLRVRARRRLPSPAPHRPARPLHRLRRHRRAGRAGARGRRGRASTSSRSPTTTRPRGWAEAAAALPGGLPLVRGAEISCVCGGHQPAPAGLPVRPGARRRWPPSWRWRSTTGSAAPRRCRQAGRGRAPDHLGARARQLRAGATVGRPHVADTLVEAGVVRRPHRGLRRPCCTTAAPFFVGHYDLDAVRAVRLVREAGGVAGLRPPGAPSSAAARSATTSIAAMAAAGLAGLEVDHPDHDAGGPRRGCAGWPPSSACWSPAPATTTAPARPSGSARTPPTPRCVRGAARPGDRPRGRR